MDISKITNAITRGNTSKKESSATSEVSRTSSIGGNSGSSLGYGNFSKGQVFRGQITNISPNEISIELENGEILNAKYNNSEDLSIGDGARFKVLSNEDNTLTIKALSGSSGNIDHLVTKVLDSSGLPYSAKNVELVTALLKNEYPVNRPMINSILQQSLKNPEISLKNLVLMNKAGLSVTPEFSALFEAHSEDFIKFTSETDKTFQSMLEMIDGLLNNGDTNKAAKLALDFLNAFKDGIEADENALSLIKEDNPPSSVLPKDLQEFNNLLKESFQAENTSQNGNPDSFILFDTSIGDIFSEEELLNIFTAFENSDADASSIQKLLSGELTFDELSSLISGLTESELHNPHLLPKSLADFCSRLQTAKTQDVISELLPKSAGLSEASEIFKDIFSSSELTEENKAILLRSGDFRKTLELLVKTNWSLSPKDLLNKEAVTEFYSRMYKQISKLSEVLQASGEGINPLSKGLSQMRENIHFLDNVSQYYNFVELPLRFQGKTTAGDLYVYSDKSKKAKLQNGSISCLLHLDMQNLGPLNVRIELQENSVSTKFYLEDRESGNLISSHLSELDSALNKQGLLPNSKVVRKKDKDEEESLKTGKFNLMKDFLPTEIKKKNFTRYTFDVRA